MCRVYASKVYTGQATSLGRETVLYAVKISQITASELIQRDDNLVHAPNNSLSSLKI